MHRTSFIAAAAAALSLAGVAQAQDRPLAVGGHIGTTGVGAEVYFNLNPMITLRAGGDYGRLDHDLSSSDIDYSGKAEWTTADVGVDLHPWSNPFFVSAGLYAGDRTVDVDAVASSTVVINGVPYAPAQLGTISGRAELSDTAPFLGVGYDNTFYQDGSWGFRALLGVAFSDDPSVRLSASGPFADDPNVQTYLRDQEREIQDDADVFKTYPVLQVGANVRF